MKMHMAILAVYASTLTLAQADVARANYGAASESKSLVRTTEFGPEPVIVLAFKISENDSPMPVNRKSASKSKGKTTAKGGATAPTTVRKNSGAIFDRRGNQRSAVQNRNPGKRGHKYKGTVTLVR